MGATARVSCEKKQEAAASLLTTAAATWRRVQPEPTVFDWVTEKNGVQHVITFNRKPKPGRGSGGVFQVGMFYGQVAVVVSGVDAAAPSV